MSASLYMHTCISPNKCFTCFFVYVYEGIHIQIYIYIYVYDIYVHMYIHLDGRRT